MAFVSRIARSGAGITGLVMTMALAGCQSGAGGLGLGLGGGGKPQDTAQQEKYNADELRAYCPRVTLQSGTAFYNSFEKGAEGDRDRIVYQASISEVTRSCSYGAGTMTITVAAAGKVVPGPVAKDGTITMPIRVAVVRGEEVLYSKLHQYQTAIAAVSPATQFVFTDPNATIPTPDGHNIQVLIGFDEGPAK
ncbi:hypothetical protein ABGN05_25695 [Aquibium sp. LZ166]|uniref:Lipoprotein n=1 Tax=Aquibium pacificus TaxID=3153579 RepID=A0ABV3STZ2_9HYPH